MYVYIYIYIYIYAVTHIMHANLFYVNSHNTSSISVKFTVQDHKSTENKCLSHFIASLKICCHH